MLQRGDETLEDLRAPKDDARLGQAQGHIEEGFLSSYKYGHRKVK